jgi:hypothetical protein
MRVRVCVYVHTLSELPLFSFVPSLPLPFFLFSLRLHAGQRVGEEVVGTPARLVLLLLLLQLPLSLSALLSLFVTRSPTPAIHRQKLSGGRG